MLSMAFLRLPVTPLSVTAPSVETWYWFSLETFVASSPASSVMPKLFEISKVFCPAMLVQSEMTCEVRWLAFMSRNISRARRPPHPLLAGWSGSDVCQWVT